MSNFTTVSFSGAGVTSVVADDAPNLRVRHVVSATPVAGGETLTITHGSDVNKIRNVRVINSSGVQEVPAAANPVISITRTSATVTTIVFHSGAGSLAYTIVIEY